MEPVSWNRMFPLDFDIVYKPHFPESGRGEPAAPALFHVVRLKTEGGQPLLYLRGAGLRAQLRVQGGGELPVFRLQQEVPGTHGQAVLLAQGRAGNYFRPDEESLRHPPDKVQLLKIFLTEVSFLRADEVQQLHHHGQDAFEMAWPVRPAKKTAFRSLIKPVLVAVGVHLCGRRKEQEVGPGGLKLLNIFRERARIPLEVARVVELRGG